MLNLSKMKERKKENFQQLSYLVHSTHYNPPASIAVVTGTTSADGEVLRLGSDALEAESRQDKGGLNTFLANDKLYSY